MNSPPFGVFTMTINGEPCSSETDFPIINPADETILARAPDAAPEQLDSAVIAARAAFPDWSARAMQDRQRLLLAMASRLSEHADKLARLITLEQGKPIGAARGEIDGAVAWLQYYAAQTLPENVIEDNAGQLVRVSHHPLGVVGAITPWNAPALLAIWKVAPALAAGNCVVLKPSPTTPLCSLAIGELCRDILPPGVLNVISGRDPLGQRLAEHAGIDKIAFTGSSATGRAIMASAAPTLKRLTLELGGNDAAIIFPDIDLDAVVPQLFLGAFANSGQICTAIKRLYVHEDIYDELFVRLEAMIAVARVGNGLDETVMFGPLQNKRQFDKVVALIDDARRAGLDVRQGQIPESKAGFYVPLTLVRCPPEDAEVVAEEAFGPVLPVLSFNDDDDVVARANRTQYGLAGSVWSNDWERAEMIAARLDTGTVWINQIFYLPPFAPFAGVGQSGLGVENGIEGLLAYTSIKTTSIKRQR